MAGPACVAVGRWVFWSVLRCRNAGYIPSGSANGGCRQRRLFGGHRCSQMHACGFGCVRGDLGIVVRVRRRPGLACMRGWSAKEGACCRRDSGNGENG